MERVTERLGDKPLDVIFDCAVADPVSVPTNGHQIGPAQLGEMLRHRRLTRPQMLGQLAHRVLAAQQGLHETKTCRIRQQLHHTDRFFDVRLICVFNYMRIHA